jgi:hypothetical protein
VPQFKLTLLCGVQVVRQAWTVWCRRIEEREEVILKGVSVLARRHYAWVCLSLPLIFCWQCLKIKIISCFLWTIVFELWWSFILLLSSCFHVFARFCLFRRTLLHKILARWKMYIRFQRLRKVWSFRWLDKCKKRILLTAFRSLIFYWAFSLLQILLAFPIVVHSICSAFLFIHSRSFTWNKGVYSI